MFALYRHLSIDMSACFSTLEGKYGEDESFVEFLELRQGNSQLSLEDLLTLPVSQPTVSCHTITVTVVQEYITVKTSLKCRNLFIVAKT